MTHHHRRRSQVDQANDNLPRKVYVNIQFKKIGEIDVFSDKYGGAFYVEAKWLEHEFIQEYDEKTHWNPRIYVENIIQAVVDKKSYHLEYFPSSDCTMVTEKRKIEGFFWERLELNDFPVDLQELSLVLASELSVDEVALIQDPDIASSMSYEATNTFICQQVWNLYFLVEVKDKPSYDLLPSSSKNRFSKIFDDDVAKEMLALRPKIPKIVATCFCSRRPDFFIWNAYLPIFLLTSLVFGIFSVTYTAPYYRVSMSFTVLLTSITFKWLIHRTLPADSYLTSLDKYSLVCITFCAAHAIWHAIVGGVVWSSVSVVLAADRSVLGVLLGVFCLIHVGLVAWFAHAYRRVRAVKKREAEFIERTKQTIRQGRVAVVNNSHVISF